MWIALALLSAFLTAVIGTLTKAGLEKVDPFVALAIQSTVLMVFAWGVVAFQGRIGDFGELDRKSWTFLGGAGVTLAVATAVYYLALKSGPSSAVQPVDRLSLAFAIAMAAVFLKEKLNWASYVGGALMVIGALVVAFGSPKK